MFLALTAKVDIILMICLISEPVPSTSASITLGGNFNPSLNAIDIILDRIEFASGLLKAKSKVTWSNGLIFGSFRSLHMHIIGI